MVASGDAGGRVSRWIYDRGANGGIQEGPAKTRREPREDEKRGTRKTKGSYKHTLHERYSTTRGDGRGINSIATWQRYVAIEPVNSFSTRDDPAVLFSERVRVWREGRPLTSPYDPSGDGQASVKPTRQSVLLGHPTEILVGLFLCPRDGQFGRGRREFGRVGCWTTGAEVWGGERHGEDG